LAIGSSDAVIEEEVARIPGGARGRPSGVEASIGGGLLVMPAFLVGVAASFVAATGFALAAEPSGWYEEMAAEGILALVFGILAAVICGVVAYRLFGCPVWASVLVALSGPGLFSMLLLLTMAGDAARFG
jgi:hypothetical protein